jgi:Sec7-like guanine-nucleotide exchange factor
MSSSYPLLAETATTYFSSVANSVPLERLFSNTGQLISKLKNRLEGKFASKLIFLNSISEEMWPF